MTIDQWAGWKVLGKFSKLILKIVGTTGSSYNGEVTEIFTMIIHKTP